MMTSNELLGFMPQPMALDILEFVFTTDKAVYRTVLAAVAEARRVRPIFMEHQSRAERHPAMLAVLSRPAMNAAAGNLIRLWLLKKHTAMLADFLEQLGIPHTEGVVENLPNKVEDDKLRAAVDTLLGKYPKDLITVYLNAFNSMNETAWDNLTAILHSDPRLQF
ncbi:MAG: hypothetical protein WCO56_01925 [Verrucomicrobiota bacterium]